MIWNSILLIWIIVISIFLCYKNDKRMKWMIVLLLPIYTYCLMRFTITGRVGTVDSKDINLFPGESLITMLSSPWNNRGGYEYIEAVGNILLFVPLGVFLRKCFNCKYQVLAIFALFTSILIEYTQLSLLIGVFEIDDVIHNTWGCFIGANLVYLLKCIYSRKWPNKKHKLEWGAVFVFFWFSGLALILYLRFILYR